MIVTIAFALSSAATFSCLHAADPALKAAPTGAPEKIEFSGASSTAPKIPRPGVKTEDLLERYGNVREPVGGDSPAVAIPPPMSTGPTMQSKAAAERLMRDWDLKKNWLVPGAREEREHDALKRLEQSSDSEKDLLSDKREGIMERFLKSENPSDKAKTQGPIRSRDLRGDFVRDRDRDSNKLNMGPTRAGQFTDDKEKDENDPRRDPNDNKESNGLADFNLKKFIRDQNAPNFLNNELPKANQLFRATTFGNPNAYRDPDVERTKQRERDAVRSAEFMQILRPHATPGFAGVNDPINSPDLSRREMNPITPQMSGSSGPNASPFTGASSPSSRIQDNAMFGVTGPAASSITPSVSAPLPRPEPRARAVVIEPPRRIAF